MIGNWVIFVRSTLRAVVGTRLIFMRCTLRSMIESRLLFKVIARRILPQLLQLLETDFFRLPFHVWSLAESARTDRLLPARIALKAVRVLYTLSAVNVLVNEKVFSVRVWPLTLSDQSNHDWHHPPVSLNTS